MSVGNRIPSLATASAACLLLIVGVVDVAVLATSSSGDDLGYETASTRSDDWSAIASSRGKSVPEEHYYHSAPGMVRLRELANTHAKMKIVAKLHDCLLTGKGNVAFVNDVKPHWDERMTLLQWAAYHGEADVVKFLLSVPGMRLNTQGYLGRTALHWASFRGRNDVVSSLLQAHGIDVDARDAQQQTPLHLAMMNQQFKVIQLLLDVDGISVNAMDWDRKTPLQYALERWQGPSPSRSLRRTIQKLIRVGAGVGTTEMSPLYWAVDRGLEDVVELLLSMHVDVNFGRPSKKTPLYNAVKKDHPEIVEMLLNVPGIDLVTGNPLLVAVQRGHLSIVKMLVNVPGIDVNAGDPLQEALQRGNLEIVELLVQAQGLDDTTPGFQQAMQYAKDHPYTGVADAILQAPTLSRGTFRKKSVSRLLCCGDVDRV